MTFFKNGNASSRPGINDEMLRLAEQSLQFRLPATYVRLLREQNGGPPARRCFRTNTPTSWAPDHIEIANLIGIGFPEGLDGNFGSAYLVQEWGYPDIGLVIADTPSGGHDAVMLDYSKCGREGEPRVVYVDDDQSVVILAHDFAAFADGLEDCAGFSVAGYAPR